MLWFYNRQPVCLYLGDYKGIKPNGYYLLKTDAYFCGKGRLFIVTLQIVKKQRLRYE